MAADPPPFTSNDLRIAPSGPYAPVPAPPPASPSPVIQYGYDCCIATHTEDGGPQPRFLSRDLIGTPLQVSFPTFSVDSVNTLEVEYSLCTKGVGDNASSFVALYVGVSTDGGTTWFDVRPSGTEVANPLGGPLAGGVVGSASALTLFVAGAATATTFPCPGIKAGDPVVATFDGANGSPLWVQGASCAADGVVTAFVWNNDVGDLGPASLTFNAVFKTEQSGSTGQITLTGIAAIALANPAPNPLLVRVIVETDGDFLVAGVDDEIDKEVGLLLRCREIRRSYVTQASPSVLFGPIVAPP